MAEQFRVAMIVSAFDRTVYLAAYCQAPAKVLPCAAADIANDEVRSSHVALALPRIEASVNRRRDRVWARAWGVLWSPWRQRKRLWRSPPAVFRLCLRSGGCGRTRLAAGATKGICARVLAHRFVLVLRTSARVQCCAILELAMGSVAVGEGKNRCNRSVELLELAAKTSCEPACQKNK